MFRIKNEENYKLFWMENSMLNNCLCRTLIGFPFLSHSKSSDSVRSLVSDNRFNLESCDINSRPRRCTQK